MGETMEKSGELEAFDTHREGESGKANSFKKGDIITAEQYDSDTMVRMFPDGSDLFWEGYEKEDEDGEFWIVRSFNDPIAPYVEETT